MGRIAFIIALVLVFTPVVWGSEDLAAAGPALGSQATHPSDIITALNPDEEILIRAPGKRAAIQEHLLSYSIKAGGAFAVYDSDFRDFVDYGVSVSLGAKKKIKEKLSFLASLDLIMLTGDWDTGSNRESIILEAEEHIAGYPSGITGEDVSGPYPGSSYHSEGEALVTSAELLRRADLDTTLFIVPVSLNLMYEHSGGNKKKISPYVGGGLGFCMARREVESKAIKEQSYQGAEYRVRFDDAETVFGQLLQVFGGIEVPFRNNIRLVAEASAAMYDLDNFEPVLEISYTKDIPEDYRGEDLSQFSYEDPIKVGVFEQEIISSFSIGIVVPF